MLSKCRTSEPAGIYRQVEARPRVSVRGHETRTGRGWVNSNAVGTPRERQAPAPHTPVCVYGYVRAYVCKNGGCARRGARWGDLLTQFVENMTQPRLAPSRYVHRAPSPSPTARVSLFLSRLPVVPLPLSSSFRPSPLPPSPSSSSLSRGPCPYPAASRVSSSSADVRASFFRLFPSASLYTAFVSLVLTYSTPAWKAARCLFLSSGQSLLPPPRRPALTLTFSLPRTRPLPHSSLLPRPTHLFTRRLSHSFPYE